MPIYAYRCASCGHAQDVLQRMSDPLLTVCPACGAAAFSKQVTAAGFQLKGSGWYVTDFRGGNTGAKKDEAAKPADGADAAKPNEAAPPKPADAAPAKAEKSEKAEKAEKAAPSADKPAAPAPPPKAATPASGS